MVCLMHYAMISNFWIGKKKGSRRITYIHFVKTSSQSITAKLTKYRPSDYETPAGRQVL